LRRSSCWRGEEQLEREQVEARQGHLGDAEHAREHPVAEHGRDRGQRDEEHEHEPVHAVHAAEALGLDARAAAGERLHAESEREQRAHDERETDRDRVAERESCVTLSRVLDGLIHWRLLM
jgi:hypothetical protein